MSKCQVGTTLTRDIHTHPAVEAWGAAMRRDTVPASIDVVREGRRRAVYRLPGLGMEGAPVIAKRLRIPRLRIERTVYEEILPHLALTTPHYYGSHVTEAWGWIFLEDVGEDHYADTEPRHRELGARWLGALHTGAADVAAARSLPDAGAARYLRHLRAARDRIVLSIRSWSFPATEAAVLEAVAAHCDAIENWWHRVAARVETLPPTLVHGDFQPKNLRLRADGHRWTLWAIDWEMAGFGPPAADLMLIDLPTYWKAVRCAWPELDLGTIERMAAAGRLFQTLATVDWASQWLVTDTAPGRSEGVFDLEFALRHLPEIARTAGAVGR